MADDKRKLWQFIRAHHPELARQLEEKRGQTEALVPIDRYPAATNDWLRGAIRAHKPSLEAEIHDEIEPRKSAFEALFNPEICVRIDDLIEALLASQRQARRRHRNANAA